MLQKTNPVSENDIINVPGTGMETSTGPLGVGEGWWTFSDEMQ